MNNEKAHFFDKDFVPKTVEELYSSGWKEYLLYHIRRYNLNDINNSPEDVLQDMLLQMIRFDFLAKYDPERTDFIKYLKIFIRNFMSKIYAKEHNTKHGDNIINAVSLVETTDESGEADGRTMTFDLGGSSEGFEDYVCLIQSFEEDLKEIKATSTVLYHGKEIKRDPYTLYKLLVTGYSVKEIAEIFGTSKQFVYGLKKKLYAVTEMSLA